MTYRHRLQDKGVGEGRLHRARLQSNVNGAFGAFPLYTINEGQSHAFPFRLTDHLTRIGTVRHDLFTLKYNPLVRERARQFPLVTLEPVKLALSAAGSHPPRRRHGLDLKFSPFGTQNRSGHGLQTDDS